MIVRVRINHKTDIPVLLHQCVAQTIPEANHHAGAEVLRPHHGDDQLIAAAAQAAGGHIGLITHFGCFIKNALLRLLADSALGGFSAQHNADGTNGDAKLLRNLFDRYHRRVLPL